MRGAVGAARELNRRRQEKAMRRVADMMAGITAFVASLLATQLLCDRWTARHLPVGEARREADDKGNDDDRAG
jgi:hypothetical protein